ncbi:MAG TPA: efflux RND transporter periplasmic adaptor subunit [Acidobacteriaceae bacterium]|nr:efflux RND transporter periplasmic adaptor subunit [Acidobacteriaceae bacterium]
MRLFGISCGSTPKPTNLFAVLLVVPFAALIAGCNKAAPPPPQMQAMPVQVQPVSLSAVPASDTYVSTIKSRRSATLQPQVDGNLTKILVKSGDAVKAGQLLMQIDPLKQVATVQAQQGTEQQQKSLYDYQQAEVARQQQLFNDGIISKQAYDQAVQAFQNSKAALSSASAQTNTQRQQLAYYQIRAPFAGIVGDIPVHQGDYVSATTLLTTVDENKDLEAYIYVPTERATQVRSGLAVDLLDESGAVLAHSAVDFVSPQVDNDLQGILAKAPVPKASERLRSGQIVNARVTWNTTQTPTVPVLAVTRIGGQTFVYVAAPRGNGYFAHQVSVTLGEPIGNVYPVQAGLRTGDRVILSGIQFLQEGVPVMPMQGPPPAAKAGI